MAKARRMGARRPVKPPTPLNQTLIKKSNGENLFGSLINTTFYFVKNIGRISLHVVVKAWQSKTKILVFFLEHII
jgi:hypothetical protein